MFSDRMDLMARKEQCKDLLREAERERLADRARVSVSAVAGLVNKIAGWIRAARGSADSSPYLPTLTPATGK
jgi:hypothetical protein